MNTSSTETVLVCKVCQRFLNHAGVWVYVEELAEFFFAITMSSVEHTICEKCLAEREKGRVEHDAVSDPVL